jgi:hypothetical protein
MEKPRVIITEEGRSGSVIYEEDGRRITGWWEFAGGDAIALVNMGGATEWRNGHSWAVERRTDILRIVAGEVVRQKAGGCKADIDEEGGWITIHR